MKCVVIGLIVIIITSVFGFVVYALKKATIIFRQKTENDIHMSFKDFKTAYYVNPDRYKLQKYYVAIVKYTDSYGSKRMSKIGFIEFNFIDRLRYWYWTQHPADISHQYLPSLRAAIANKPCVDIIINDIEDYLNGNIKKGGDQL